MIFDGIFRRHPSPKREPEFSDAQAVIVDINLEGVSEFGTKEDRESVLSLEERLAEVLPAHSGVDGHEFGEGTATLYIYGPSADAIFSKIKTALEKSPFNAVDITLRYGRAEDPKAREKRFSL